MTSTFPLAIGFDNPDPLDRPADFTVFVALLNELIRAEIEGNFVTHVTGSATPSVDDQDKIWYRTDGQGRPIGTYVFYNGAWRREYDHRLGEVLAYKGNPSVDFTGPGRRGTIGGEWDGFQLCNGENGSPNFTNKFIVGADMDGPTADGFAGYWQTTVNGVTEQEGGGTGLITLEGENRDVKNAAGDVVGFVDANVPRAAREEIKIGRWTDEPDESIYEPGPVWGFPQAFITFTDIDTGVVITIDANEHIIIPAEPAVPPLTLSTLPPYYALAYAIFVGYA